MSGEVLKRATIFEAQITQRLFDPRMMVLMIVQKVMMVKLAHDLRMMLCI